ncbi:hypothetical protein DW186_12235, partial [Odoribacter sp. AM16-33]
HYKNNQFGIYTLFETLSSPKDFESSLPLRKKQSNNERVSTQKLTLFLYFKGFEQRDGGFVTQSKNNRNLTVE